MVRIILTTTLVLSMAMVPAHAASAPVAGQMLGGPGADAPSASPPKANKYLLHRGRTLLTALSRQMGLQLRLSYRTPTMNMRDGGFTPQFASAAPIDGPQWLGDDELELDASVPVRTHRQTTGWLHHLKVRAGVSATPERVKATLRLHW